MMRSFEAVPTIDLTDYTSCDTSLRSRFIGLLGAALTDCGFVIVEGHAIDARLIREVYAAWRRFFALDAAAKGRYAGLDGGARGFTPFGVEHARDNPTPDQKEFWHVAQEPAEDAAARAALAPAGNVWPDEVPEARGVTLQLYRELERVAQLLLMALAEHLGLPEDALAEMVRGGASVLRIAHYPAAAAGGVGGGGGGGEGGPAGALRAAPHQDINLITLLCEATDAGLEVMRRDGVWMPVAAGPGQIVVDAGEMLSRITNEVVPATVHRVIDLGAAAGGRGAGGERYSLPFFVHPRPDCELAVLDRFVSSARPRRFPPITAGALLDERLHEIGLKG